MTKKITKVIAALGVVAGLGVAALPLSSYAADVTVSFTIQETVGTVDPNCSSGVTDTEPAGADLHGECNLEGSSNTGIQISIKDADSNLNLVSGTNNITPIGAVISDANFTTANLSTINSGAGGWGFRFSAGANAVSNNLSHTTGYDSFNAITAADQVIAKSSNITSPTHTVGASISFRAVVPPSQPAGTYTDIVTVTVAQATP